jgi:hypothetical protein
MKGANGALFFSQRFGVVLRFKVRGLAPGSVGK